MSRRTTVATSSQGDGPPVTHLCWSGEIDISRVPELRDEIMALPTDRPVVLDLSRVSYLDSSGLGMLVLLRKRLARCGVAVTLVDVQPHVRRVFDVTGLDRAFHLESAPMETTAGTAADPESIERAQPPRSPSASPARQSAG
jgi:anti-sigma B factor antagonist